MLGLTTKYQSQVLLMTSDRKQVVNMALDQGRTLIVPSHAGFCDHENAGMVLR